MNKRKILILGGSSDIAKKLLELIDFNKWEVTAHYSKNKFDYKDHKINLIKSNFLVENEKTILKKFNSNYDSIINLVGFVDNYSFKNTSSIKILSNLKVNSVIPLLIFRKSISHMKKNNWGRIVNTSSIGIKFGGGSNNLNYSISKHVNEFIPSDLKKLSNENIFINCLRIGVTDTKIHQKLKKNLDDRIKLIPLRRSAKPMEIASFLFYLSGDKNQHISNQVISLSGGE